jgi:hypothetical protein
MPPVSILIPAYSQFSQALAARGAVLADCEIIVCDDRRAKSAPWSKRANPRVRYEPCACARLRGNFTRFRMARGDYISS